MLNSRTFRIFISSTFSDFLKERAILQEDVFPRLDSFCRDYGYRFQPIDLRWGITGNMGEAHETMKVCLEEIRRCQRVTPRPNFVLLLGDRYGWRPVPAEIPMAEFRILQGLADANIKRMLETWYWQDDNAVPSVFVLQPKAGEMSSDPEWNGIEKELQSFFRRVAHILPVSDQERVKYYASATEQEIWLGALNKREYRENTFAFMRSISNLSGNFSVFGDFAGSHPSAEMDKDASICLENLKQRLRSELQAERVFEYSTQLISSVTSDGSMFDIDGSHLEKFAEDFYQALKGSIYTEIMKLEEERSKLDDDSITQENFVAEKIRHFVGRHNLLSDIHQYIDSDVSQPLAIAGSPGSGKTALVARCVSDLVKKYPGYDIQYIFVGLTANSSSLVNILARIGCDLTAYFDSGGHGSSSLKEALADRLSRATDKKPVIVIIDALDQIAGGGDMKRLAWLPFELPPCARMIVSTIDTDPTCAALEAGLSAEMILRITPLPMADARTLLFSWLAEFSRTLTDVQVARIFNDYSIQGLPLYLKMVFERAKKWRSYQPDLDRPEPTVEGVIGQFLERLCRRFGEVYVKTALSYFVRSKNGLAEEELLELLFFDDDFRLWFDNEIHFSLPPGADKIPVSVWSGLYFELEPFLVEKRLDGISVLGFFHRLFYKVIQTLCLDNCPEIQIRLHERMAVYFKKQNIIRESGEILPSRRKLSEWPYHQTLAGCFEDILHSLGDFGFLEAKLSYDPFAMLEDFSRFKDALGIDAGFEQPEHVLFLLEMSDFIERRFHFIVDYPQLVRQFAANEPDSSRIATYVKKQYQNSSIKKCINYINRPQTRSHCLRTFSPPDNPTGNLQICKFLSGKRQIVGLFSQNTSYEYLDGVFAVETAVNRECRKDLMLIHLDADSGRIVEQQTILPAADAIAWSLDDEGRIVQCRRSGEALCIELYSSNEETCRIQWSYPKVRLFVFTSDYNICAFACIDGTLVIHDATADVKTRIMTRSAYIITSLEIDACRRLIYVGNADGNLSIWSLDSFCKVSSPAILSVALSEIKLFQEHSLLVGGDHEGFIKFWPQAGVGAPFLLPAHESGVVSIIPVSRELMYTAAADGSIRVWDFAAIDKQLRNQKKSISGFWGDFSPDGKIWAFWGEGELTLWNTADGNVIVRHANNPGKYTCTFTSDGRLFFVIGKKIMILNPDNLSDPILLMRYPQRIVGISARNESELLFWSTQSVRLLDLKTKDIKGTTGFYASVRSAGFFSGCNYIFAQTSTTLNIFSRSFCESSQGYIGQFMRYTDDCEDFCFSEVDNAVFSWKTGLKGASLVNESESGVIRNCRGLAGYPGNLPGRLSVVCETGEMLLVSYFPLKEISRVRQAGLNLLNAQFAPDGNLLATINQKNLLQFHNLAENSVVAEYGVEGSFKRIVWSRDGSFCALEGDDSGEFMLFELPLE